MMQDKLSADGELEKLREEAVLRVDKEIKELKEKRWLLEGSIQKIETAENFESYQNYASGKTDSFQSDDIMLKISRERLG